MRLGASGNKERILLLLSSIFILFWVVTFLLVPYYGVSVSLLIILLIFVIMFPTSLPVVSSERKHVYPKDTVFINY